MIKEAFQDLNRVRQIAAIAARHGFADLLERSDLARNLGKKETVVVTPEKRRESVARRFRMLLNDLGPTYIKLGQVLSTRADLLPSEVVHELAALQDEVPPLPFEGVKSQIQGALGKDLKEIFASFDEKPLGAASIAQVHRATLLSGEEVVVKVQRPGIAEQIRSDLSVLRYLAKGLEAVIEEMGVYSPSSIVDEFDRAIYQELDFLNEASNIRAFYKNHEKRDSIKIPKVYEEYTSRTVLTMERIVGTRLAEIDAQKHDRHALARKIIDASFQQLFEDGLFHGDPHPGNMFVLEGDKIALIDFGLVGRLTKPMQDTLVQLVLSVALRDSDSTARILYRIGAPDARTQLLSFKQDIDAIFANYLPGTLGEIDARTLLNDLLDLSVKHRIRLPKEYAILSRASVATEGILRMLAPDLNVSEVALPYAKKLLGDRFDPSQMQGGMLKALLRLQTVASELPTQMSQILLDMESGRFSVNVSSQQFQAINGNLRNLAAIGFLGLCACGFIIGTFIALNQQTWNFWGLPVMAWVGLLGFSSLFGTALTWYWFSAGPRKISLSKWLKQRR